MRPNEQLENSNPIHRDISDIEYTAGQPAPADALNQNHDKTPKTSESQQPYNNREDDDDDDVDNDSTEFHAKVTNARPEIFRTTLMEVLCIIVLTLAPVAGSISTGGMQICLDQIGTSFDVSGGTLSWAVASFSLASGSFFLFFGGVADIFGRRIMVVSAFAAYAVFSLISGFMHSYIVFCVFRALQGISVGAAIPSAVGILGASYRPGVRKNKAMAVFAAGAPIGFVIGIISGGISAQFLSFRAELFFIAIVYTFATVLALFVIPKQPKEENLNWEVIKAGGKKLDYGGTALAVTGFTLFVFSLSQAEAASEGWRTPYIIALLIVGVVIIALFTVYETYIPKHPLMPMSIWTSSYLFPLCMLIMSANWMNFTGTLSYYGTLYFEIIREASPILTTAYWVPQAVAGVLVNVVMAYTLHWIPGRILMLIATLAFTGSALIWSFIPLDALYWAFPFPAMILVVIGADIGYNVANMLTLTSVPPSLQSSAAGVFNTILQLSTAIGLSASSAIASGVSASREQPLSKKDLLDSYHAAFYFAVGVAGSSVIGALFLKVGTHGAAAPDDNSKTDEEAVIASTSVIKPELETTMNEEKVL